MIISHKHRFIFIHCRKAAGSSVVTSLSRHLGNNDLQFSAITDGIPFKIYPPLRVVKEALKTMTAKEIFAVLALKKSFWGSVSNAIKKKYFFLLGRSPAHAPASAVATAFPEEWRDYFKFCIVRNPWDKTLSDYYWRTKRLDNPPTFDEYVAALEGEALPGITPENHQNWDMYTINDQVAVDFVVRFEDMAADLKKALTHTSVKWDGWMPHMKKGGSSKSNAEKRNYRDYYSERTAQIVERLYEKEIKEFGYRF